MQQAPVPMLQTNMMPNPGYENAIIHNGGSMVRPLPPAEQTTKAFPCSSCGKGFARRSDLARHERIHSGIRPHICDYPGCSKQFIQRSALTVHARVHTGEKPHMCERCGKPFSDSSSLARHRRIHSGKRPYKCPYADCQKTFTRRTTLTRHQNHHTGTVEEAAAATAAALATRTAARAGRGLRIEDFSDSGSPISNTPSPHQRPMSLSPAADLPPIPQNMHRQAADYVTWNNGSLPPHMRVDIPQQGTNPRSSPTNVNGNIVSPMNMMPRSHPARYAPPPSILEPPANPDLRQQQQPQQSQQQQHQQQQPQQQSAGNMNPNMSPHATSPHLSNVGWQSPTHQQMAAAPHAEGYIYPDPYGSSINVGPHMYYQNSNIRRPQSAEPHDAYDAKPRMNELWAAPVS
ncbi:MAG: hypothetical protein M1829_005647 [Trizodia sp. TS-e1964]|nr:MAG: hypothetical protein M1829_005647 [Trizodia sp. TS-e1964]